MEHFDYLTKTEYLHLLQNKKPVKNNSYWTKTMFRGTIEGVLIAIILVLVIYMFI